MKLTCVMPAFNEEKLIEASVSQTIDFWQRQSEYEFHLIVVDDGSTDATLEIVNNLNHKYKELSIVTQKNTGKGGALRHGVESSSSDGILYMIDSDMPFSLKDQLRVVKSVSMQSPVVYGSRVKVSGFMQSNSVARMVASFGLGMLNKCLLRINIRDNQCGLKAFQTDLAKEVFRKNEIGRWGFDLFITSILTKYRIPIGIEPVTLLEEQRASRVRVVSTSFQLLYDIFKIKRMLASVCLSEEILKKYSSI